MPQDTAALARIDVPQMDPERLVRTLATLEAEIANLKDRLTRDNARLQEMIEDAREAGCREHADAMHKAGSAIRDAAAADKNAEEVRVLIVGKTGGNGLTSHVNDCERRIALLEEGLDGLSRDRRQAAERRQAMIEEANGRPGLGDYVIRVLVGALAVGGLGTLLWLLIAAGPRILAIWGAGGGPTP